MAASESFVPPGISRTSSAVVLNDMINSNLRINEERSRAIDASGLIENAVRCVADCREMGIPIFWIRVERRADRADHVETITDEFIARGGAPRPAVVGGTWEAANIDEMPVLEQDHVILKPRFDPFFATDLDYQLRVRGIDTILLGGYSTNAGVESCARTARDMGYNVVLLSDCSYNIEEELHHWALEHSLPKFSRVLSWSQARELID